MLDTLQRRHSESVTDTIVIFKLFCFQKHVLPPFTCSARFSNGDFSHCGELTISAHHGDPHLTCRRRLP